VVEGSVNGTEAKSDGTATRTNKKERGEIGDRKRRALLAGSFLEGLPSLFALLLPRLALLLLLSVSARAVLDESVVHLHKGLEDIDGELVDGRVPVVLGVGMENGENNRKNDVAVIGDET